jgi:hypothetical protein
MNWSCSLSSSMQSATASLMGCNSSTDSSITSRLPAIINASMGVSGRRRLRMRPTDSGVRGMSLFLKTYNLAILNWYFKERFTIGVDGVLGYEFLELFAINYQDVGSLVIEGYKLYLFVSF